ncbi:MAG: hypothetical protein U0Q22_08430 [Acidimicrobiales bacterium]
MQRRTAMGVAAGLTLGIAGIAAAVGLSLGIMSGNDERTGPGTFEPVVVESPRATDASLTVPDSSTTTAAADDSSGPSTSAIAVDQVPITADRDHDGDGDVRSSDHRGSDDRGSRHENDERREHESGHDDDD